MGYVNGQWLEPGAGLFQFTNGVFYGTTYAEFGGDGSIYSESVGLGPFVIDVPSAGKAGQGVIVLGTNLSGATSVTFNGKGAKFKVASATEITATVPAGATTGTVQVVAPSGTLKSNVPFRVIQ
jgi:DnaJ-class molecular chaperone